MDEKLEKIHRDAILKFERAEEYDRDQRRLAIEDARFAHAEDGQWSDDDIERRADRPRYTFNRVIGTIKQITGEHKQNRSQGKVLPEDGGSDEVKAKVFSGIIRKIESRSKAQNAYDCAFDEKVTGGFGGWRILTEFKDDSFDQEIVIKPIVSACTSLYKDPASIEITGCDSQYQFLTTFIDEEVYKAEYPDAQMTEFKSLLKQSKYCSNWSSDKLFRIAEYWVKESANKTIALMSDGKVLDLEDEKDVIDELAAQGITIIKQRNIKSHNVVMYKMNGVEILSGPHKFAGKHIPLIHDIGEQYQIEDKRYTRGIVRLAKDANRIYNYSRSTDIETYALTPKDPYWITVKQSMGQKEALEDFPRKNQPFMIYTPDSDAPGPPARTGSPSVNSAGIEISRQSIDDIHATTSMYPPAMGNAPQLLSEKSVKSQAEKGDIGAYVYQDNHEKALAFSYEVMIDLIPRIYDTEQTVQILGVDGVSESIELNQTVVDEKTGKPVIVNDLSIGKYSVLVETGPAFSTQREESAQQLIELADNSEVFAQLTPDLIAKNLNIVESEEFVKRIRKFMITQGIAEPTEDEIKDLGLDQPQAPDPEQEALKDNVLIQTEKLKSEIEMNDAKTQETLVKTQALTIETLNELLLAMQKKAELGMPVTSADKALVVQQTDIAGDAQDITQGEDNPNSEQLDDLDKQGLIPQ